MKKPVQRPSSLFRYRSIDTVNDCDRLGCPRERSERTPQMGRLESLIKTGAQYFAHPRSFNDPFECRPQTYYDPKGPNTTAHVGAQLKKLFPTWSPAQRVSIAAQVRRAYATPRDEDSAQDAINRDIGILCLVERPDNLLMWAHYGDSHRGVCLEFDTSDWLFRLADKVDYSERYPVVDTANQTSTEIMRSTFVKKSIEWKYEQEWRVVSYRGLSGDSPGIRELYSQMLGHGVHLMPTKLLRRIIFGANASDEAVALVKLWVQEAGLVCSFSRCKLARGEFRLQLEELN